MSQPLKESTQVNFVQSHCAPPSKLYTILKAESNKTELSAYSGENHSLSPPLYPRSLPRRFIRGDPHEWQCWQCYQVCEDEEELASHLMCCKRDDNLGSTLPGCPFCPKDIYYASTDAVNIRAFNAHVTTHHSEITQLACAYCLKFMSSSHLEELSCHVLREHHIPWRPSPATLAYLRNDQLPHRAVTCMGCGRRTFLLHANNAVQPPFSLAAHMDRCAFNGGRVYLTPLTPDMYATAAARKRTLAEAERASWEFSRSFPLVRGHPSPTGSTLPQRSAQSKVTPTVATKKRKGPGLLAGRGTPVAKKSTRPRSILKPRSHMAKSTSVDHATGQFDVPLTLPPLPKADPDRARRVHSDRLYVCPLCGDNALASLRERDEHLQGTHHGELVFPCQICGLAYPLYIALRRHAALKHDSDFDTVRYGRPELLDSDSVECPVCKLVAFTDRAVLKLHVVGVHKQDPELFKLPNKPGARGGMRKGTRRKSKYGDHNDGAAYAVTQSSQPVVLSRLEQLLAGVPGDLAPVSCRICHTEMDNAKEFLLHLELDHVETEEECEQLGCQACGRIFFGPGGRIDLIGHLRVCHQETDQPDALSCLQAEKVLEQVDENADKTGKDEGAEALTSKSEPTRPCDATFSSPRLRQLHCSTSAGEHPGFSCPLTVELSEDQELTSLTDQIRAAIMETEVAADREGLMILAYCCPNCSRLFAGNQAPSRFESHRRSCVSDEMQSDGVTLAVPAAAVVPATTATSISVSSASSVLQPVTRIEIQQTPEVAPKLTATALIKDATPVPMPVSATGIVSMSSSTENMIVDTM